MPENRIISLHTGSRLTLRSSASLIIDGDRRVLVDPGFFSCMEELDASLFDATGEYSNRITDVFYTHLHFDHYNWFDYPNPATRIYMPGAEVAYCHKLMQLRDNINTYTDFLNHTHEYISPVFTRQFIRFANDSRYDLPSIISNRHVFLLSDGMRISDRIETMCMRGHSVGQLGLLCEFDGETTIVAGDAVLTKHDYSSDDEKYLIMFNSSWWAISRNKLQYADWIVPGHGPRFKTADVKPANLNHANRGITQ